MALLAELFNESAWLPTAVLALVVAVAAIVVHHVVGRLLRRAVQGAPVLRAMLASVRRAAGAALPLLALQLVWVAASDSLRFIGNIRHVNGLLLIGAVTWLAMAAIAGLAQGLINTHPADVPDNIQARRIHTQAHVLSRSAMVLALITGASMALMTFPGARQVGASLLASAGVLGLVAGLAARPVFSNMISGLQLALAQPLRLDDVLIVKGEWGTVEEITGTYVVLRIWDDRRLIIPLQWFIENPFENWTRNSSQLTGLVVLHLDYATPMDAVRAEARRIVESAPEWDGRVFVVQVQDVTERAMQVRIMVSALNAGKMWDLRCRVREAMLAYLAREYPQCLPQMRVPGLGGDQRAVT